MDLGTVGDGLETPWRKERGEEMESRNRLGCHDVCVRACVRVCVI